VQYKNYEKKYETPWLSY